MGLSQAELAEGGASELESHPHRASGELVSSERQVGNIVAQSLAGAIVPGGGESEAIGGEIAYSSRALATAAKELGRGAKEVTVGSRQEAEELFLRRYQGAGYRNTTGMTGNQVRNDRYLFPGKKLGTYHWDEADMMHGGRPHLQIHTFDGRTLRIFYR